MHPLINTETDVKQNFYSINYIASGSTQWGIGHLKRSLEIITALRKKNNKVTTTALVSDSGDAVELSSILCRYDRVVQNLQEIQLEGHGIIVDVPEDIQPSLYERFRKERVFVIGIDWYSKRGKILKTVINLRGNRRSLKFAIIRDEFLKLRRKGLGKKKKYGAVIAIGGADNRWYLKDILKFINAEKSLYKKKFIVIQGPLFKEEIISTDHVSIVKKPDHLAEIMAGAEVGISNGGTTLMEFMALGIPTIIFPQSKEEDAFIQPFLRAGCAKRGVLQPKEFSSQILKLWYDKKLNKEMAKKAHQLIDGKGVERLVKVITKTFDQYLNCR